MPNRSNKKKNGTRNRNRRGDSQAAAAISQLLSIMPSKSLGSTTALGGQRGAGKPKRRRAKAPKSARSGAVTRHVPTVPLPPTVRDFFDNWHPFTETVPLPFHTTNVEQSIAARGIRYAYEREISCPANSTTWILIGCNDYLNIDATSSHVGYFVQNGNNYVMGPVPYSGPASINSCVGFMYQRLNAVNYPISGNLTGNNDPNSNLVSFSDSGQQWPIASSAYTDAVRWCPISYGVDIKRTNAALNAAGDWFSATPVNGTMAAGQQILRTTMSAFPSFKKHGSEHVNLQLLARPHDMAYQHCIASAGAYISNPAIVLNFENGTSNALSFDLCVSAKYAVAGSSSTKLLSSIDASPSHAHILSTVSTAVGSGMAPGHATTTIAEAVHSAVATGKSAMAAAATVGQKLKATGEWLKPFVGVAAGFAGSS